MLGYGRLVDNSYYIDMELCRWNLDEYIRDQSSEKRPTSVRNLIRSLKDKQIWSIMKQIASGVNHIHSHNQVHRDLKPANGMLLHFH